MLIVGLAIFGVLSQLTTNFTGFIKQLLYFSIIISIILVIGYFLVKFLSNRSDEMKKYKQAVRQSKRKYRYLHKEKKQQQKNRTHTFRNRKNRSHLHVIDGKKK